MLGRLQTLCDHFTRSLMGRQERVFFPSGGLLLRRLPSRQTSPYDCCMGSIAIQSSEGRYRPRRDWRGKKGNWERLEEFGSSAEERGRTRAPCVGRGQIGVRVCVWERDGSGRGVGWQYVEWERERESQMASARNHTLRGASVENEPGSGLMFPWAIPFHPFK